MAFGIDDEQRGRLRETSYTKSRGLDDVSSDMWVTLEEGDDGYGVELKRGTFLAQMMTNEVQLQRTSRG